MTGYWYQQSSSETEDVAACVRTCSCATCRTSPAGADDGDGDDRRAVRTVVLRTGLISFFFFLLLLFAACVCVFEIRVHTQRAGGGRACGELVIFISKLSSLAVPIELLADYF
jgi:hypothetical protein